MTEIADRVRKIVLDHFAMVRGIDPARVVPAAHLVNDLDADSLDIIEIVCSIEEQFGREIPEDEMERLVTVGDVIALIDRHP